MPDAVVAEKGVTIVERGITSTRWRDYVDVVQLALVASYLDPVFVLGAAERER